MGLERLVLALPEKAVMENTHQPDLYIIALGSAAMEVASKVASQVRQSGKGCYLEYEERSLKAALRAADRLKTRWALILGEDELRTGQWLLKDLQGQTQRVISESGLLEALTALNN